MSPDSGQNFSVWWVAAAGLLLVLILGTGVLVASYNEAHRPPHSESWDGPLIEMRTCAGPVEHWVRGVHEHRSSTRDTSAHSEFAEAGFVAHFVTAVVPWHLERRPLLPLLIVCAGVAVLMAAWQLRAMERAEEQPRKLAA